MTTKLKILGAPGTGKTTALRRITEHLLGLKDWSEYFKGISAPELPHGRYSAYDFAFMTYTTSQLEEFVVNRLNMSLDAHRRPCQPLRYFRTIHGVAYTLLIDNKEIDSETARKLGSNSPLTHFKFFCRKHGLFFDTDAFGFSRLSRNVTNNGNLVWQALSRAINIYYPKEGPNAIKRAFEYLPFMLHEYVGAWELYKNEHEILDYNDMIVEAFEALRSGRIEFPVQVEKRNDFALYNFRVIVIDEFQDVSPLQYAFITALIERAEPEIVIVAGDPDQAIYNFQGASPRFLLEWAKDDAHVITLKKSKRVPEKPRRGAQRIISKVDARTPFDFEARDYPGVLNHIFYYDIGNLADRILKDLILKYGGKYSIMILARTNKQVLKLAEELLLRGVSPNFLKVSTSWTSGIPGVGTFHDLLQAVQKLRRGEKLQGHDKAILFFFSEYNPEDDPAQFLERLGNPDLNFKVAESRFMSDPKALDYKRIAFYFNDAGAKLVKRALEEDTRPVNVPKNLELYLDTLHSSKGREADIVAVINEMPIKPYGKVWARYFPDRESLDAERRLWYVGLTRARKGVWVYHHPRRGFPDLLNLAVGGD